MEKLKGLWVKQREDHMRHFIDRLAERYGINICGQDYDDLCNIETGYYLGLFRKTGEKTIGIISIKNQKVYVLYHCDLKLFSTCYPLNVGTIIDSCIRACFNSAMHPAVYKIVDEYFTERLSLPIFPTIKDAGMYLFTNTMFPQLHMEKYKYGTVSVFKIMQQVDKVLRDEHPHIRLTVVKRSKEETAIMQGRSPK